MGARYKSSLSRLLAVRELTWFRRLTIACVCIMSPRKPATTQAPQLRFASEQGGTLEPGERMSCQRTIAELTLPLHVAKVVEEEALVRIEAANGLVLFLAALL